MSSSASSGVTRRTGLGSKKGIPRYCRCGKASLIRTSETEKNPGRLFYCCPYGSKESNEHLFKWTDISIVEEMEAVESMIEKIQEDVGILGQKQNELELEMETLTIETRVCEAVTNSFKSDNEELKNMVIRCEREIEELKSVVNCCKNLIVGGVIVGFIMYFLIA